MKLPNFFIVRPVCLLFLLYIYLRYVHLLAETITIYNSNSRVLEYYLALEFAIN